MVFDLGVGGAACSAFFQPRYAEKNNSCRVTGVFFGELIRQPGLKIFGAHLRSGEPEPCWHDAGAGAIRAIELDCVV